MITDNFNRLKLVIKTVTRRELNILDLLEMDHLKVRALGFQIKTARDRKRQEHIFSRIAKILEAHTHAEEAVFYPACRKIEKLKEITLEAQEEHKQVKTLLKEIKDLARDSDRWEPKVRLLLDNFEHHVKDEEGRLFPKVRRYLDYKELEELARELTASKKKERSAA